MQSFAGVINGILWVTEPLDVGTLTYCANPVTGQSEPSYRCSSATPGS
jgi:hypothetical protein